MVPDAEISLLVQIAEQVIDLAATGKRNEASARLMAGLRRARRLRRIGLPWAPELVSRYEFAIAQFVLRYGKARLRPGTATDSRPAAGCSIN